MTKMNCKHCKKFRMIKISQIRARFTKREFFATIDATVVKYVICRKVRFDMNKIEYFGTLGPSCAREEVLEGMFQAGMTGIRLNLSHKSLIESRDWVDMYQKSAEKCGKKPELLIDLMGPEIRIGDVKEERMLSEGDVLSFGEEGLPIPDYIDEYLTVGQRMLVDDGKIELEVIQADDDVLWAEKAKTSEVLNGNGKIVEEPKKKRHFQAKVLRGGIVRSRKSLALPGIRVNNPTLTAADQENLKVAKDFGVTAVMLPFVRGKEDLLCLRKALNENGGEKIRIFAKIENMEGVEKLPELLPYCDHIVIARGDLGNAVPLSKLPVLQQQISEYCNSKGKPFMVVTQMLNSMIEGAVPTRAEVTDIFHAIKEGASSVMLTGETAAGKYPVEAMTVLVETGEEARSWRDKNLTM